MITSIVSELDLRPFVVPGPQFGLSIIWTFRVIPGPVAESWIARLEGSVFSISAGHDHGAIVVALAVGLATGCSWVKAT